MRAVGRRNPLISALALTVALGAATWRIAEAQLPELTPPVTELNDSGVTGTVRLSETDSGGTEIAIRVTDGSRNPLPTHIHEGRCADLNPEPKIPLADVSNGVSRTELTASLAQLTMSSHAIFLHKSAEELPVLIACADIDAASLVAVSGARAAATGDEAPLGAGAALVGFGLMLVAMGFAVRRYG